MLKNWLRLVLQHPETPRPVGLGLSNHMQQQPTNVKISNLVARRISGTFHELLLANGYLRSCGRKKKLHVIFGRRL